MAFVLREVGKLAAGDDCDGIESAAPLPCPSSPASLSPASPRSSPSPSPSSPLSPPASPTPTFTTALTVPPTTTWSIWRRKRITTSPTRADAPPALRKHYQSRRVRAAMRRHMVNLGFPRGHAGWLIQYKLQPAPYQHVSSPPVPILNPHPSLPELVHAYASLPRYDQEVRTSGSGGARLCVD